MIDKPKVQSFKDFQASGLVRVLTREGDLFPEFALYPRGNRITMKRQIGRSLRDAGLKEEAEGKWILRTNKFNIFVYV
jgi:hypothetical protein